MLFLAWSTIKGRAGGFVAALIAVVCGAAVITACGILLESGLRSGVASERFASAAVIAGASQSIPVPEDVDPTLAERVTMPADSVAAIARVPGVRAAVPDLNFPLDLVGGFPATGHAWSSTVLAPFALAAGTRPDGPGEVVLEADLARRAGVGVGGSVDLVLGSIPSRYEVVGLVTPPGGAPMRQPALFLSDEQAQRMYDRPGRVDMVGVLADPGVDPDVLAERISGAVDGVVTYTGEAKGDVEFLDVGETRGFLIALAGAFGGSMTMVVMFVVTSTLGISIQQRRRELALLRAIAATPRQIHRMIGGETLLVSAAGAALGLPLGVGVVFLMGDAFTALGVIPVGFRLAVGPLPMVAAFVLCVGGARIGGLVAARRAAKVSPIDALGEAAVEPARLGPVRVIIATVLALVSLGMSLVLPVVFPGELAAGAAASSSLLLVIAAGLLGPWLVNGAVSVFGPLLSRESVPSGFLAGSNARANSRRLSSAITPLILGVTMAAVQIFNMTTMTAAAREQARTGVVADYVLVGTSSGISPQVAQAVEGVAGVAAVTPVVRTQVLVSYQEAGDQTISSFPAQGVTAGRLPATMDLDPRRGRIEELTGETVALSRLVAGTFGADVGDTVEMRLGDGTAIKPEVVAVYGNGLGFGDVTLPHDLVIEHTTNRLDSAILVAAAEGADVAALGGALREAAKPYPTLVVTDRRSFEAAQDEALIAGTAASLVLNALLLGYLAIAVVNTLVMATSARSREFALLRLVGASHRQVRAMMRGEARIVIVTAVVFGTLAAVPPLVGVSIGMTESPFPTVPPLTYLGIVAVVSLLGWASIMVSTRLAMRPRPVDAIGVRE